MLITTDLNNFRHFMWTEKLTFQIEKCLLGTIIIIGPEKTRG